MPATTIVGLDVGSTSIRAVEASLGKDRPVVTTFAQAPLPAGAVVGGVIKDEKVVTSTLRRMWTSHRFSTKNVVLGVTHQQVIVREIDVANLPAKELKQALPFLVRDSLPLPVEQAQLDFYSLEDPGRKETVHGLVIAAPKDVVLAAVAAVEDAGLHVAHVDLACFAALRSSAHLAGDTEALVDLGASATNIVVHTDGTPKIVRTVPRGGAEITKMLAERLSLSSAEAETLKCRDGLRSTDEDGHTDGAEIVTDALRPLMTEIRSSFNYFTSAHPQTKIKRIALVGGAALLPGLSQSLGAQLGIPAFLSDPLQRVGETRKGARNDLLARFRSSAAVSIGLTLGAA